jgi:glycosyltransferase involved in cell wall biosynthesis
MDTTIEKLATLFYRKPNKTLKNIMYLCKMQNLNSVVVVMSYPGDDSLQKLSKSGVTITRVLHDLRRHPGDFWPTKRAIKGMLEADKLIALSDFVFKQIEHKHKYLSSLSRRLDSVTTSKVFPIPQNYILIVGRFKKYKNIKKVQKALINFPNVTFLCAGVGSKVFLNHSNTFVINRWLSDGELEFLIMQSRGLIAVYSEASQSGIVDQALYWRKPVLVSDKGALPEQVTGSNAGIVCNPESITEIVEGISKLLEIDSRHIKYQAIRETLFETLNYL